MLLHLEPWCGDCPKKIRQENRNIEKPSTIGTAWALPVWRRISNQNHDRGRAALPVMFGQAFGQGTYVTMKSQDGVPMWKLNYIKQTLTDSFSAAAAAAAAVLGCIEAKFCKYILNTHVKALAEIYKIHSFAPLGIRCRKERGKKNPWTSKTHNEKEGKKKRVSRNSQKQKMNYLVLQREEAAVKIQKEQREI